MSYLRFCFIIEEEQFFNAGMQNAGDMMGQPEGWIIFSFFKKNNGLPPDSCFLGKIGLSYPLSNPEFLYPGVHGSSLVDITLVVIVRLKEDGADGHEDDENKDD